MAAIGKNARLCETCGSTIDESSVDLGCMICLLDAGLDGETEQIENSNRLLSDEVGVYTIQHRVDGSVWELGHGAMGVTYLALDTLLDRSVALKIINSNLGSRSAEARERFMREARAAAALRHPNVATVYQFGIREATGQFFYAMELVEGETLEERVRRLGPLDVLTTIDIGLQVAAALEAAEERGLVHRDLKPGNLMLVNSHEDVVAAFVPSARSLKQTPTQRTTSGSPVHVKVIDFGVAKAVAEKTNAMALTHGGFVGTPAFASPEQFTNAPVDVRSDIYSLGVTLWFLLTGHMLFSGRTIAEIQQARQSKPLPIEQLKAAQVPHRIILLLTSMLAIEPAARPAGARELSTKLRAIRTSITGRRKMAIWVTLAAAIVAVGTFVAVRESRLAKTAPSLIPEKSIAVLPFENLSGDPNNAYLAEGIQEQILTQLAKIADLKVISRTSTQRYHSKPVNLVEIAKQLGVANILEGSVQKETDQVRINVQLITAQTQSALWSETYDRSFTTVLGVESEIAKRIAESLRAKLTGHEERVLVVRPTNNPEAYDAYLRGIGLEAGSEAASPTVNLLTKAVSFYERAVQLDPNFAIAWARLSRVDATLYHSLTTSAAQRDSAKLALQNAQKLEPNSPETLLALGYYQYLGLIDYAAAKDTLGGLSKMLPGSSEVPHVLGDIARSEGHWDQSIAYYEQGLALDPRNVKLIMKAAWTYAFVRQFPAALKLCDRALDITLNDQDVRAAKAAVYQAQGNLQQAAKYLSEILGPSYTEDTLRTKITHMRLERNYGEAIRLLQGHLAQFHFASDYDKGWEQVALSLMQRLAGDPASAKVTAQQARNTFEQLYSDQRDNPVFATWLSQAYAMAEEKDPALSLAEHAVMLAPAAKDRLNGPSTEENLAFIETISGENSHAISTLSQLLQTPYYSWVSSIAPITPALLRLDPIWDPLRADPAFQKLCQQTPSPAAR